MNSTTLTSPDACALVIGDFFDSVFSRIEGWRAAVEDYTGRRAGLVHRTGIDRLVEGRVAPELAGEELPIIGAGFVAAPGFIADAHWHLAWWLGGANSFRLGPGKPRIRRLDTIEDPASDRFRDYTTLEWWRVPRRTGQRHITGPYVDYLCTDEYTLTLTTPVFHGGEMIGVAGADLYVKDVERALLPPLRSVGPDATLVNASGRVLVSANAHVATGSLVRTSAAARRTGEGANGSVHLPVPPHDGPPAFACGDTGLIMLAGR